MAETFEYSKAKHEREVLASVRRDKRLQMAVAIGLIAFLAAAYLNQTVLHWF